MMLFKLVVGWWVAGETVDDRANYVHVDDYWPAVGLGCLADQAVELYK